MCGAPSKTVTRACGGVDRLEVFRQRAAGDVGDRAGELDAGRPAADDGEAQRLVLAGQVGLALGVLEGQQHAAADLERVLDRLQAGRVRRPVVMAEIGVPRPGGDDQVVVGELRAVLQLHPPRGGVEADDLAEEDLGIAGAVQDPPERGGDLAGREDGGGNLVEEGLEGVVVLAVHQRDLDRLIRQSLSGVESRETTPHDHHFFRRLRAHVLDHTRQIRHARCNRSPALEDVP